MAKLKCVSRRFRDRGSPIPRRRVVRRLADGFHEDGTPVSGRSDRLRRATWRSSAGPGRWSRDASLRLGARPPPQGSTGFAPDSLPRSVHRRDRTEVAPPLSGAALGQGPADVAGVAVVSRTDASASDARGRALEPRQVGSRRGSAQGDSSALPRGRRAHVPHSRAPGLAQRFPNGSAPRIYQRPRRHSRLIERITARRRRDRLHVVS